MKRILYVEDDEDTAEAVKTILEVAGFAVTIAPTGSDGIRETKGGEFDIILLDIMLPDMSGWDLYRKMKGINAKFAFLSALPISQERLEQLRSEGLCDYITKPFTKKDLTERVKKMAA